MNKPKTTLVIVFVIAFLVTESAPAFVFRLLRRRAERRKAEIRGEILWELSAKMDSDLAREMETVDKRLQVAATSHIQEEGRRLEALVRSEVSKMHQQAEALLAREAKKLGEQTAARLRRLQTESQAKIAAESNKLKDLVKSEAAGLRRDADTRTKDTLAKLADGAKRFQQATSAGVKAATADMQKTIGARLAELPGAIDARVVSEGSKIKAALVPEIKAALVPQIKASLTPKIKAAVRAQVQKQQRGRPDKRKTPAKPGDDKATVPARAKLENDAAPQRE